MSSHQLNNSDLNRTPTWSLQPFKDFANASWHCWSVQPLGIKALVGFGSVVALGIISIIVRKALSSFEVRSTSPSDKKTDGAASKPAASPAASQRASASEKGQPASGAGAVPEAAKKEPEKTKWVVVLPNQVSQVPFLSLFGLCINEQRNPVFPGGYVQGIYSFSYQTLLKEIGAPKGFTKDIQIKFYCEKKRFFSIYISSTEEEIFLRNLPYQKEVKIIFSYAGNGKSYTHTIDQVRGVYSPGKPNQKLEEHNWRSIANKSLLQANIQSRVQGWYIDDPVDFILSSKQVVKVDTKSKEGHYHLSNVTEFMQVVILELQLSSKKDLSEEQRIAYSIVIPPRSDRIISKESLIFRVEDLIGALPAGAKIGVSNIQQIVYTIV